jgi:hypothetical protein
MRLEKLRRAGAAAAAGVKEAGMKREVEAIGGIGEFEWRSGDGTE